jgi:regulator of replication initiation timing
METTDNKPHIKELERRQELEHILLLVNENTTLKLENQQLKKENQALQEENQHLKTVIDAVREIEKKASVEKTTIDKQADGDTYNKTNALAETLNNNPELSRHLLNKLEQKKSELTPMQQQFMQLLSASVNDQSPLDKHEILDR